MIGKARAVWHSTGRAGNGELSTDSGVFTRMPYSFATRFEDKKDTNPAEMIAAAHASSFAMTLAFKLESAGYIATELSAEATVSLDTAAISLDPATVSPSNRKDRNS